MSKKALPFLLTVWLAAVLVVQACFLTAAEEAPDVTGEGVSSAASAVDATDDAEEAAEDTTETTTEPATVSLAEFPVLTVSAISNYFGRIDAEYNEFTREITVVYMLKSSKRLLSTDWTLTYDPALLTVNPEKNTLQDVCPVMWSDAVMSLDVEKGQIRCNATNMHMFDFSTGAAPFVQVVFEAAPLTAKDSEITKVDLTVNDLIVSEPNPETAEALPEKEVPLVANGKALKNADTKTVQASKYTTITPSTFTEPRRKPASDDQAASTAALTTVKPTAAVTAAVTQPSPSPPEQPQEALPLLNTGRWYVALLILVILIGCSIVLLVMRKRDIYNS